MIASSILPAERIDGIQKIEISFIGQFADQPHRVVEVAFDLDDLRTIFERLESSMSDFPR